MSEFGIRIKNIQAGSLYDVNLGVRDELDMKDAMLVNSLFKDFIVEHGLRVWKEESTRDIICIEFKYGSRGYLEEYKHLQKLIKECENNQKLTDAQKEEKIIILQDLLKKAEENQDKYDKKTKEQIRDIFYTQGVDVTYHTHNRNGRIIDTEIIHYKMLFRSPGKAKKGSCMFINEKLYDVAKDFLYMGIKLPEHNSPIVEMGAYASLIASSIIGRVMIEPENILVLKDVDSFFKTKVISIETDNNKHCYAKRIDDYELSNTMFDGQAIIDHGIFPEWADGYILLRHHLCKMAAFDCNLQLFFRDYYGDRYETAEIIDMFGKPHKAKDIKLVTTDNAMKWLKFGVSYDYWSERVRENGCEFGIVKTTHKSKFGDVQRMSYQMVNALDIDSMPDVYALSLQYVHDLKNDNKTFLKYLEDNQNFSNDYEVLLALVDYDPDFIQSEYFKNRKMNIVNAYIANMKTGKLMQNADNLTIIGSPYAMLLYTVGEDVEKDDTLVHQNDYIQCFTERFENGEILAEFRNPYNSKSNMGCLQNIHSEKIKRYFNLGQLTIAINMLHTDFQDRNNGSDQDSDSIYVTNAPAIVECARKCYRDYPTIVNNIPKEKNIYDCTLENYALIDNNLAAAQLAIGESSNLAQVALSYTYNFNDQRFEDYVSILSVLAQCAIDNAKRRFDIDLTEEIRRIKTEMQVKQNGYPVFWKGIRRNFNEDRINKELICPMNVLYNVDMTQTNIEHNTVTYPMTKFFVKYELGMSVKLSRKVERFIQKYALRLGQFHMSDQDDAGDEYLLLRTDFDQLIYDIQQLCLGRKYAGLMSWLIDRAFFITPNVKRNLNNPATKTLLKKNRVLLLKVLYSLDKTTFLSCFSGNTQRDKKQVENAEIT